MSFAEDARCCRNAIGSDSVLREDRGEYAIGQPDAGARIHDVGVTFSADLNELLEVSRCGDGAVREKQSCQSSIRSHHVDSPTTAPRRCIAQDDVSARFEERPSDTMVAQQFDGTITGISLRNSAEVELHLR